MLVQTVCASHSPLIYLSKRKTFELARMRRALDEIRESVIRFAPDLIILFGCDHYGGHQMASMPAFCVGTAAQAVLDVGGTAGRLNVPRKLAVSCVDSLRDRGIDTAISYAMDVDHGFSQILHEVAGGIDRFPVLPVFVACLQPPFVPFRRARALGTAMAHWLATVDVERVLILGTGGLSHNPESLFPSIDNVSEKWLPYHLMGTRQNDAPQADWFTYEWKMHELAAERLGQGDLLPEQANIRPEWDEAFLERLRRGALEEIDRWVPAQVVAEGGFGAMEVLTWIAAGQMYRDLTGRGLERFFYQPIVDVGVGFGIAHGAPSPRVE